MKIAKLQSENDRHKNIAEKKAYKLMSGYYLQVHKHISAVAQNQSIMQAEMVVNSISELSIKEIYQEIYLKIGWDFANIQDTRLQKQKKFNVSFFNEVWRQVILKQLNDVTITLLISKVTQEMKDYFRKLLKLAESNNMSTAQVARLFRENIPISKVRALRIARTEMGRAAAFGVEFASSQSQLKLYKVWIHSKMGNYRESHAKVNGTYVDKDGTWKVGEYMMKHPHDPNAGAEETVNCRCSHTYLTEDGLKDMGLWRN